ncbi:metal transporter CNNM3 isoform 1 precursor, partial [Daubentonia madagascariensis]
GGGGGGWARLVARRAVPGQRRGGGRALPASAGLLSGGGRSGGCGVGRRRGGAGRAGGHFPPAPLRPGASPTAPGPGSPPRGRAAPRAGRPRRPRWQRPPRASGARCCACAVSPCARTRRCWRCAWSRAAGRRRRRRRPWALGLGAAGLLALAALARGLQLSALALAPAEVQVLRESGSEGERAAARRLEPARRWAGCALGALLLLASLAQAALAVLLYRAAGQRAVPAVLGSAGLVFLVGEVVPAAVSGRWALALAPSALSLSRLAVLLTLPVALPVGQLLELAARPGRLRERVLDLARGGGDPYSDLSKGVLRCRTVEDVLTPLEDCFMLDARAVLDFGVLASIMQSGYTRIPVYEEERSNIVDMLYLKDLAFVDPEDCTPLSTITRFYNHPLHFVFNDTKLDAVLEEFKRGKSHLAIVQKVNNEGEGDPFYEVLGLVTLEDVIEEIIKSEILDESEDYRDGVVRKKPASLIAPLKRKEEFSLFKVSDDEYKVKISPQLLLATQRFLSREVDVFSPLRISEKVLLHLLKHPSVNQEVKFDESNRLAAHHYLYQRSQPVDYFILILQGRVEVEIGKEGLKFENGAFTYYGVSALTVPSSVHQSPVSSLQPIRHDLQPEPADGTRSSAYCPDYTVRALSDLQLIKVTRLQYLNALLATRAQNLPQSPENTDLQVIPGSQTRLLGEKTTAAAGSNHSRPGVPMEESPGRNPGV